jgi:uncharacterized iron-regulated protein
MVERVLRGGEAIGEAAALAVLAGARVALLGERHDDAADHAWQARVIEGIVARAAPGRVAVGFEMVPRRAQGALDAWGAGHGPVEELLEAVNWTEVWGFPPELYRRLFELCREKGLRMLGLNVDRPIVSLVGRDGWDALPAAEQEWLTPAPPATAAHRRYLFAITGGRRPDRQAEGPEDPRFDRFVRAQQVWDRAFACAIAAHLARAPEERVVGLIGRGHLEFGHGTPEQLADLGVRDVVTAVREDRPARASAENIAGLVWTGGSDPR